MKLASKPFLLPQQLFFPPNVLGKIDFYRLCFHTFTNPFSRNSSLFTSIQIPRGCGGLLPTQRRRMTARESQATRFQLLAAPLTSLCALLPTPILCFQQVAASSCKTPGGGTCSHPRVPLPRTLCALRVILASFFSTARPTLFQSSTVGCRLPFHNAKIRPVPL